MINDFLKTYDSKDKSDSQGHLWALGDNTKNDFSYAPLHINNYKIQFTVDTASSSNIIDQSTFDQITPQPILNKSNVKLYAYGFRTLLPIVGEFNYRILYKKVYYSLIFQVISGYGGNILSKQSLLKTGIVKIITAIDTNDEALVQRLKTQYPALFSGKIGKLKGVKVKLHINPKVRPVRQRRRPVLFH